MHRILVNNQKNRLYLKLSGNVDYRESRDVLEIVIKELENLRPGFDVISNLCGYMPISRTADTTLSSALKTVKEHGIRRTIRIVEDRNYSNGFGIKLLENDAGINDYETVYTLDEAEEILEHC